MNSIKNYIQFISVLIFFSSCNNKELKKDTDQNQETLIEHNYLDTVHVFVGFKGSEIDGLYKWDFNDSIPHGNEVDIITNMFNDLNIKYEFIENYKIEDDIDFRLGALTSNSADISICGITITNERKNYVDFSLPYEFDESSIMILKKSKLNSISDLKGKKVFAGYHTTQYKWLKENIYNIKLITEYDTKNNPINLLKQGEIDAFASSLKHLQKVIIKEGNSFRILNEYLFKEPLGIAVSKNKPELLKIINQYIELKKL